MIHQRTIAAKTSYNSHSKSLTWVTEMYKVTPNLQPENISSMFNLSTTISGKVTRRTTQGSFYPPRANFEVTIKGFRHRGVKVWDMVPNEIKLSKTLNVFENKICQIKRSHPLRRHL